MRRLSSYVTTTEHREWLIFLALVGPNLLLFSIFTYYPLVYNGYLSFTYWDMLAPTKVWVGLDNYIHLFTSDAFMRILLNTVVFTVGSVAATCGIGFVIALLLNMPLRSRNVVRGLVTARNRCTRRMRAENLGLTKTVRDAVTASRTVCLARGEGSLIMRTHADAGKPERWDSNSRGSIRVNQQPDEDRK